MIPSVNIPFFNSINFVDKTNLIVQHKLNTVIVNTGFEKKVWEYPFSEIPDWRRLWVDTERQLQLQKYKLMTCVDDCDYGQCLHKHTNKVFSQVI